MNEIVIHIGLPKTASTFLQHHVFPNIPGTIYQNKYNNYLSFSNISDNDDNIIVISNEDIPGWPHKISSIHNSYEKQFRYALHVIKSIYRDPKIIVCFREPSKFIYSTYKQHLHEGGTVPWEKFFSLDSTNALLNKEDFFFSRYVDYLAEEFPIERLFVYNFDDFNKDNQSIANKISMFVNPDFTGQLPLATSKKANPAVKYRFEHLLIILNKYDKKVRAKWGSPLELRMFGKVLNARVMCQYLLPKITTTNNNSERDLSHIKEYYEEDWQLTKQKIDRIMILDECIFA